MTDSSVLFLAQLGPSRRKRKCVYGALEESCSQFSQGMGGVIRGSCACVCAVRVVCQKYLLLVTGSGQVADSEHHKVRHKQPDLFRAKQIKALLCNFRDRHKSPCPMTQQQKSYKKEWTSKLQEAGKERSNS